MAPYPDTEPDTERKKELVMEKRLSPRRVNIIPRDRGYLSDSESYTPPQVIKRPQSTTPFQTSVTNAKNPIAMRYWENQKDRTFKESTNLPLETQGYAHTPSHNANCKLDSMPKAAMFAKVPDITTRVRSESLPETKRVLQVTASVIPSPVLNRKLTPSELVYKYKEQKHEKPILARELTSARLNSAYEDPKSVFNQPEVNSSKLVSTFTNGSTSTQFMSETKNGYENRGNLRNMYTPVPFQSHISSIKKEFLNPIPFSNHTVNMQENDRSEQHSCPTTINRNLDPTSQVNNLNANPKPVMTQDVKIPKLGNYKLFELPENGTMPVNDVTEKVIRRDLNSPLPILQPPSPANGSSTLRNLYSPFPFQDIQSITSDKFSTPFMASNQNVKMQEINKKEMNNQPTIINRNSPLPFLEPTSQFISAHKPPKPTMNQQAKIQQDSIMEEKVIRGDLISNAQVLQPKSHYQPTSINRNLNSPSSRLEPTSQFNSALKPPTPTTNQQAKIQPFDNPNLLPPHGNQIIPSSVMSENVQIRDFDSSLQKLQPTSLANKYEKPVNLRNLYSPVPFQGNQSKVSGELSTPFTTSKQNVTMEGMNKDDKSVNLRNLYSPVPFQGNQSKVSDDSTYKQNVTVEEINKDGKLVNQRNLYSPVPFQVNQSKVSDELSTPYTTSKQNTTLEEIHKDEKPVNLRNLYSPVPFQGNQSNVSGKLSTPFTTSNKNVTMEEMNKNEKPVNLRNIYSPVPFKGNQSKVSCDSSTPFATSKKNVTMEEMNKDEKYNQPTNVNINLNSRLSYLAPTSQVNGAYDDPKPAINQTFQIKHNENPELVCPRENIPVCDMAEKVNGHKEPVMLTKNIYSPVPFRSHISKVKTELGIPNPPPSKNVNEIEDQNTTSVNQNYNHVDIRKSLNSPLPWQTPQPSNRNQNNNHIFNENDIKSEVRGNEKVENRERNDMQNSITSINVPKPLSDNHHLTVRNETLNPYMGSQNIINKLSVGEITESANNYEQPLVDQAPPILNDDNQKENAEIVTQNTTYNQTANKVPLEETKQTNPAKIGIDNSFFASEEIKDNCISREYLEETNPSECHQPITLPTSPPKIAFKSEIPKSNELESTNNYAPLDKMKEYTEHLQVRKDFSSPISVGKQVAGSHTEKSTSREGQICEEISVLEEKEILRREKCKSPQIPSPISEARLYNQRQYSPSYDIQASVDDILEKLSIAEKTELNLKLFSQLPNNIKEEVLAQHLTTVPITHISSIVGRMPVESANRLIPNLFMKAADDVKLSLILDCLPKLSVEKILKDLNESEKEARKDSVRKMTRSLMSHRQ